MSGDSQEPTRIYLGLFENKWAAVFFGGGMALFIIGTAIRATAVFLS